MRPWLKFVELVTREEGFLPWTHRHLPPKRMVWKPFHWDTLFVFFSWCASLRYSWISFNLITYNISTCQIWTLFHHTWVSRPLRFAFAYFEKWSKAVCYPPRWPKCTCAKHHCLKKKKTFFFLLWWYAFDKTFAELPFSRHSGLK